MAIGWQERRYGQLPTKTGEKMSPTKLNDLCSIIIFIKCISYRKCVQVHTLSIGLKRVYQVLRSLSSWIFSFYFTFGKPNLVFFYILSLQRVVQFYLQPIVLSNLFHKYFHLFLWIFFLFNQNCKKKCLLMNMSSEYIEQMMNFER